MTTPNVSVKKVNPNPLSMQGATAQPPAPGGTALSGAKPMDYQTWSQGAQQFQAAHPGPAPQTGNTGMPANWQSQIGQSTVNGGSASSFGSRTNPDLSQNPFGHPTAQQPVNPLSFGGASGATGTPVPHGTQTTEIDPANDLRGQAITPGYNPQLTQTGQQVGQAANQVSQFNYSPYSAYQSAQQPYTTAGNQLLNQAQGTINGQQQYLTQAGSQLAGIGNIGTTVGQPGQVGSIAGPSWSQGNLTLPGVSTGQVHLNPLSMGADTNALRGAVSQGIQGLNSAPNRGDIAASQFKLLNEQLAPQQDKAVRDLGQSTAAFGRMGSGLVNSQLADIGTQFNTTRQQAAEQLANDSAAQQMQDQLNKLNATQSGLGQLSGLDVTGNQVNSQNALNQGQFNLSRDQAVNSNTLNQGQFNANLDQSKNAANLATGQANAGNQLAQSGLNLAAQQALYGQNANNQQFGLNKANALAGLGSQALQGGALASNLASQAYGRGDQAFNQLGSYESGQQSAGLNKLGALSNVQGNQFNQDLTNRNELRGERGYQDQLAQQAQANAIQQMMAEMGLQGNDFSQQMGYANALNQQGQQGAPWEQMNINAQNLNQSGNQAFQGVGNYLNQYAMQQAMQNQGPSASALLPGMASIGNYKPNVATQNLPAWSQ